MGNGIGFDKARLFLIPLVGLDRDVRLKQQSRLCGAPATAPEAHSGCFKDTVYRGRRDLI